MLPLIAVDVGNSRIKLGLFRQSVAVGLPEPQATLHLTGRLPEFDQLDAWLASPPPGEGEVALRWHIGSVNRPAASRLIDWLRDHRPDDEIMLLTSGDLPLVVKLPRPDMVGVDRLAGRSGRQSPADARPPGGRRRCRLGDHGRSGRCRRRLSGGAILPGIAMSARALHEFTDLLPQIDMAELAEPPPALGTATVAAMRSGLFWGAVGAVRQLVEQLTGNHDAEVFLTGGAGPVVAQLMGKSARYVPHLTLAGIALAAERVDPSCRDGLMCFKPREKLRIARKVGAQ